MRTLADHAVVMSRFARDCLAEMKVLVHKLEVTLGPGHADLTIRVGLHSGRLQPVCCAGARSRFQLFGDTMNTAARETSGLRDKIHISEETANLLIEAGKDNWFKPAKTSLLPRKGGASDLLAHAETRRSRSITQVPREAGRRRHLQTQT
jgi:class 3 adenylate cyclase